MASADVLEEFCECVLEFLSACQREKCAQKFVAHWREVVSGAIVTGFLEDDVSVIQLCFAETFELHSERVWLLGKVDLQISTHHEKSQLKGRGR